MRCAGWLLAFLFFALPLTARAQTPSSKEIFHLAAAEPRGSERAIALYTQYVALEPRDAWGHLALAEALSAAHKYGAAMEQVRRAEQLAPGNEDVTVVRKRVQRAQRAAAPATQPRVSYTRDSDGNVLTQFTVAGDVASAATARFGGTFTHAGTGDGTVAISTDDARAQLQVKTRTTRFEAGAGAAHVAATQPFTTGVGRVRLRVSGSPTSALFDVRATRAPLLASPLLATNHVVLSEARATVELPLGARLRLRGNGQIGDLASAELDTITFERVQHGRPGTVVQSGVVPSTGHNRRLGLGGALVGRLGKSAEVSANYYQLSYDAASRAGYFAPRLVQLAEVGSYSEIYSLDPLTIALDVGAGVQRAAPQGEVLGKWTPALRAWGQLTAPLSRGLELNLEGDFYRSQLSTVTTSGQWSSVSGALSFRWLIGI